MSSEKKSQPVSRYDVIKVTFSRGVPLGEIKQNPKGDFVLATDHEAAIEALRAERDKAAQLEVTKWKEAFAAQSRKLQAVLHIPGVEEALSDLALSDGGAADGQ